MEKILHINHRMTIFIIWRMKIKFFHTKAETILKEEIYELNAWSSIEIQIAKSYDFKKKNSSHV